MFFSRTTGLELLFYTKLYF